MTSSTSFPHAPPERSATPCPPYHPNTQTPQHPRLVRALLVLILLAASLVPALATRAQDDPLAPNAPSPATRHAQVIAHGVAALPAPELAWRLAVLRAAPPRRATAQERAPGFVLADEGAVAMTDDRGAILTRLAPGEAAWLPPGSSRAVVSLERHAVHTDEIALVPVAGDDAAETLVGEPFAAPEGDVFAIDLLRDVLGRDEESPIPAGAAPALLLVTRGAVFVQTGDGTVTQMTAGEAAQVAGDLVVTGAGRAPAAFVVARIGSALPARVSLQRPPPPASPAAATPIASPVTATPVAAPVPIAPAAVAVSALLCPVGYTGEDAATDCATPAARVAFTLATDGAPIATAEADAAGQLVFSGIAPGDVTLSATVSPEFATSHVRCRGRAGATPAATEMGNQLALTLAPDDAVACDWFLIPVDTRPEMQSTLTVILRACPPGMTLETLVADLCAAPPSGAILSLRADGLPVDVTAVAPDRWVWQGLAPRRYALVVPSLPGGFTGATIDGEPCCPAGGFPVAIDPATQPEITLDLFQPIDAAAEDADSDADGLTDAAEVALGTNPFLADSDGDELTDGDEVDIYGTDALASDTDHDGLDDAAELLTAGTNPFLADTDGDGIADSEEPGDG